MKKLLVIATIFLSFSASAQILANVSQTKSVHEEYTTIDLKEWAASYAPAVDRVLTNAEKEVLQSNASFIRECKWALKNFASFWGDPADANTKVGLVGYASWSDRYQWSKEVLDDVTIVESNSQIPLDFAVLLKGMTLWDNAVSPFNPETVVTYMIANNRFDELAASYVDSKTE